MNLSRYLVTRVVAVSIAILLVSLALALWRAQYDVQREERGAAEVVRLFEHLYALENGPAADVPRELDALDRINRSGHLRHVQLELHDADGAVRVAARAARESGLERLFAAFAPGIASMQADASGPWTLERDDGTRYVATLALNPASEQREALDNLTGMLGVLAAYGAALLIAVIWALNRALAPLQPLADAIARYERNEFSHRLPELPFVEMDRIGRALNHMAASLAESEAARRALSLKLVSSQEDERARIARELHDELGQTLTAMRADLAWLARRIDEPEANAVVVELARRSERIHAEVRDLLRELRPRGAAADGDGVPLERLLGDLVEGWRRRPGNDVAYRLRCDLGRAAIADDIALAIYRLTQEALTNVARHADAREVAIEVKARADGAVEWCIADDGVGVESPEIALNRGSGIAGMRERVWAHGGELEFGAAREHADRPGLRIAARFGAGAIAA